MPTILNQFANIKSLSFQSEIRPTSPISTQQNNQIEGFESNVFTPLNDRDIIDLITQATPNIPGISDISLEKSLQFVLPEIGIQKVVVEEGVDRFALFVDVRFLFDFDIRPHQYLIDRYFLANVEYYAENRNNLIEKSLFRKTNAKQGGIRSFGKMKISEYGSGFEYKTTYFLNFPKVKSGESYVNPENVFFVVRNMFDEESFKRDFVIDEFGVEDDFNGKAVILDVISNNILNIGKITYIDTNNQEWQGPTNKKKDKTFTYSKLFVDSKQVFITQKEIKYFKKKTEKELSNTLTFSPIEDIGNNSLVNIHSPKKLSYPAKIVFDVDWYHTVLKIMDKNAQIIANNPSLVKKCLIKSIKVYRKRLDGSDNKENLIETITGVGIDSGRLFFEENKYDNTQNEYIRNFFLVDRTIDKNTFSGTYKYWLEFELDNQIYKFFEEKQKELREARRNFLSFNNSLNFSPSPSLVDDEKLTISTKTVYNILPLFSEQSLQEIDNEINQEFKMLYDKKENDFYNNKIAILDRKIQQITQENNQKPSKNTRTSLSVTYNLGTFEMSSDSVSFLFDEIGEKLKIDKQTLEQKFQPTLIENKQFVGGIEKKQKRPFKDEKIDAKEQNQLLEFRDEFHIDGLSPKIIDNSVQKFVIESKKGTDVSQILNKSTEQRIFDDNLSEIGILDVYSSLKSTSEQKKAEIFIFNGYEDNIKNPRWEKLEELSALEGKFVLCQLRPTKNPQKAVADSLFFVGDEKKNTINVNLEFFNDEKFTILSNQEKIIQNVSL